MINATPIPEWVNPFVQQYRLQMKEVPIQIWTYSLAHRQSVAFDMFPGWTTEMVFLTFGNPAHI